MDRSILDVLDDDGRRDLEQAAWRRRFGRREVIFHAGDPGDSLHLIRSGRVAIRITSPQGYEATLRLAGVGEVFGELAVLGEEQPRSATAITVEPVETWSLHRRDVDRLRERHRSIDRLFIELLAEHLRDTSRQLVEALYLPAEPRIRRRVAELITEYDVDGGPVEIPLTQTEVATLAGTSRATVNKVLREGEEAGLLELRRGRLVVLEPQRLLAQQRRRR